MRSSRSSSTMTPWGGIGEPYSISGVVHHAFMPTTAAPIEVIAQ